MRSQGRGESVGERLKGSRCSGSDGLGHARSGKGAAGDGRSETEGGQWVGSGGCVTDYQKGGSGHWTDRSSDRQSGGAQFTTGEVGVDRPSIGNRSGGVLEYRQGIHGGCITGHRRDDNRDRQRSTPVGDDHAMTRQPVTGGSSETDEYLGFNNSAEWTWPRASSTDEMGEVTSSVGTKSSAKRAVCTVGNHGVLGEHVALIIGRTDAGTSEESPFDDWAMCLVSGENPNAGAAGSIEKQVVELGTRHRAE